MPHLVIRPSHREGLIKPISEGYSLPNLPQATLPQALDAVGDFCVRLNSTTGAFYPVVFVKREVVGGQTFFETHINLVPDKFLEYCELRDKIEVVIMADEYLAE